MADAATKHLSTNGGAFITDLRGLTSLIKTRRTMAFAYGFMFAFVAVTGFLAFSPSPNSSAPWFTNIFTFTTFTSSSSSNSSFGSPSSSRSQFPPIFTYIFPNNATASSQQTSGSNTTLKNQTLSATVPVLEANHSKTQNTADSSQDQALNTNQTTVLAAPEASGNSSQDQALNPNRTTVLTAPKTAASSNKHTQDTANSSKDQALKPNQTTVSPAPKTAASSNKHPQDTANSSKDQALKPNQTTVLVNQTSKSASLEKGSSGKQQQEKGPANSLSSNYTSSLPKKQGNGTKTGVAEKQTSESLMNCDFFDGEWVMDNSYPLYKPGSCSLIDEQFNCILNGRPDKDYQRYKWKPKSCTLPRLNPGHMLHLLKGKRLVFVGDSLNRNMWESLVCILKASVKDQRKVYEANGRHHFRGEASYIFVFKDYNCTVEFFVSPFLVREWEVDEKDGSKKETLRLDLVGRSSDQYKGADIIIFNTGHWWTHDKTSKGKDYYQEGSHVYNELNVLEAFRKALTTWGRWVDANINPVKSLVFFRGYSASHFSGGQWNSGGACDSEVKPIKNATYLRKYPPKMLVLERVLRGMKTPVKYLNITRMTDYRKDGHPSIYRKQNLSEEERRSPRHYQDCSHWCLPGVPDAWNEILYAELLVYDKQKQQAQKRHR